MTAEEQLQLSFFKELTTLNDKNNVYLVQHIDTGELFVKKIYRCFNEDIFITIMQNNFKGVPQILFVIKDDNTLITIEEYIQGNTLYDLIENKHKKFTLDEVKNIVSQLCDIMLQFHIYEPSITHRDIKASNIILDKHDKVFVIDFNITRQFDENKSQDTQLMGTFGYAAPEQYGFKQCTPQTDIYAIGVLCKYLITGTIDNVAEYKGPMHKFIKKATEIDPENRFPNVISMKKSIKSISKTLFIIPIYFLLVISISYESAKDFPVENNFIATFISDMFFLLSPVLYWALLKKYNKQFSDVLWKNRLLSILAFIPFGFVVLILCGILFLL